MNNNAESVKLCLAYVLHSLKLHNTTYCKEELCVYLRNGDENYTARATCSQMHTLIQFYIMGEFNICYFLYYCLLLRFQLVFNIISAKDPFH